MCYPIDMAHKQVGEEHAEREAYRYKDAHPCESEVGEQVSIEDTELRATLHRQHHKTHNTAYPQRLVARVVDKEQRCDYRHKLHHYRDYCEYLNACHTANVYFT